MTVANNVPCRQPPNPRYVGDEGDDYVKDENDYPFEYATEGRTEPRIFFGGVKTYSISYSTYFSFNIC